ncbi:MAG: phosphoribosylformylglycinamidine cyclo-ligase [Veillonella caviae]|uniref:phosphoribosylformylglycinamidine cyclo-ligase n=1 Tax=Veillonella caviae TaxID=248316 RepID=UPI002A90EEA2|nr:phosphoribosylformylglycinamidine cyclo-ligase [Veillonella caviae]MDY5482315.1 phosphoribosylformylglycinamidine cyclo-ligase [Veillonella caviae]
MCSNKTGLTYRDAGVDIDAGNKAVELMKESVKRTYTPGVVGALGGFGGLYSLAGHSMQDPMLVSGTDGVGTKLRLAIMMDKHDTIGQDCVAMSVNDILVQGATPLFFLDYVAVGKLDPVQVADIVRGVANACEESGCALLGGETAEMAGFYGDGDYDVAGFAVGIVDHPKLITGEHIKSGDVILGLPSSGVHSNGFSLVRKIVFDHKNLSIDEQIPEFGKTLGEELLTPTRLYPKAVLPLIQENYIKGMVHITGGGFYENIPRVLPKGVTAEVNVSTWPRLPVFSKLQEWGNVAWTEMYRTFNMGIGMILIVDANHVADVKANLESRDEAVYEIGRIIDGDGPVVLKGAEFDA